MRLARECSIAGCEGAVIARGWCPTHYSRWRKHGDPLTVKQAPHGTGYIDTNGYRIVRVPGRQAKEHRLVMERLIGRPLTRKEHVHHINGDKTDNRPENLRLMSDTAHISLHHRSPLNTDTEKLCPACGLVLPRDAFNANRARRDGVSPYCRPCRSSMERAAYCKRGYVQGERHHKARLTADQVSEIRRRYAAGDTLQSQLAQELGVGQSLISAIVLRRIWKHLP